MVEVEILSSLDNDGRISLRQERDVLEIIAIGAGNVVDENSCIARVGHAGIKVVNEKDQSIETVVGSCGWSYR
jgi:hypothetical protein